MASVAEHRPVGRRCPVMAGRGRAEEHEGGDLVDAEARAGTTPAPRRGVRRRRRPADAPPTPVTRATRPSSRREDSQWMGGVVAAIRRCWQDAHRAD